MFEKENQTTDCHDLSLNDGLFRSLMVVTLCQKFAIFLYIFLQSKQQWFLSYCVDLKSFNHDNIILGNHYDYIITISSWFIMNIVFFYSELFRIALISWSSVKLETDHLIDKMMISFFWHDQIEIWSLSK